MALTNAQRQAKYKAKLASEKKSRIDQVVSTESLEHLKSLATLKGLSQRQVLEQLIEQAWNQEIETEHKANQVDLLTGNAPADNVIELPSNDKQTIAEKVKQNAITAKKVKMPKREKQVYNIEYQQELLGYVSKNSDNTWSAYFTDQSVSSGVKAATRAIAVQKLLNSV